MLNGLGINLFASVNLHIFARGMSIYITIQNDSNIIMQQLPDRILISKLNIYDSLYVIQIKCFFYDFVKKHETLFAQIKRNAEDDDATVRCRRGIINTHCKSVVFFVLSKQKNILNPFKRKLRIKNCNK